MKNLLLFDLPVDKENDAIGYSRYTDSILEAIESDAKIIGLISSYGSGKSTITNMVKNEIENKEKQNDILKKTLFVSVNLWNINDYTNNVNMFNNTTDIHSFLLHNLISCLDDDNTQKYYESKINKNYRQFNIALKNQNYAKELYIAFIVFAFSLILKLNLNDSTKLKVFTFTLDFLVSVIIVNSLYNSKLYLSFDKSNSKRIIDESETTECFKEIIEELSKNYSNIIINIEDLDRYDDASLVLKVLEQIYKFYTNNITNVKFIVSLKPPYVLYEDNKKIEDDKNSNTNAVKTVDKYKKIYEKIFDIIINLQTVSFQNYDTVLLELLEPKRKELKNIGITLPASPENIGAWSYLYRGDKVSIRDIKHRYNYFISIYSNLYTHKQSLDNKNLIKINLNTCLFAAYIEDNYTYEFYKLLDDAKLLNDMVLNHSYQKNNYKMLSDFEYSESFKKEIYLALDSHIIDENYSMYFYKYPKNKAIDNIYDNAIKMAIHSDNKSILGEKSFHKYCFKASEKAIIESLNQRIKEMQIPEIIFLDKRLFSIAYKNNRNDILDYFKNSISASHGNEVYIIGKLREILLLKNAIIVSEFLEILSKYLKSNFENLKIIHLREKIIIETGVHDYPCLYCLYLKDMPTITINELKSVDFDSKILNLLNPSDDEEDISIQVSYISSNCNVSFYDLYEFLLKIESINPEIYKECFSRFYMLNYSKANIYKLYKLIEKKIDLDNVDELMSIVCKFKILPLKYEKNIIEQIKANDKSNQEKLESKYIEILKCTGKVSSITKMYFEKYKINNYITTNELENEFYKNRLYKEYVYSKFNREKHMTFEEEKFNNLGLIYREYFKNSELLNYEYKVDMKMKEYLKSKLNYNELSFQKIILICDLPQTLIDIKCIYNQDYQDLKEHSAELEEYLDTIVKFDSNDEDNIVDFLIEEVKSNRLKLYTFTYSHLILILNKISNKRKFQQLKKLTKIKD